MSSELMKTVEEGAIITSLIAAIGFLGRKALKEDITEDPSKSIMGYVKMIAVVSGSIGLKNWLQEKKYFPTP